MNYNQISMSGRNLVHYFSTNCRFLKRRYKYLIENQSMKTKPKHKVTQLQNYEIRSANSTKAKNYSKKGAAFRYPAAALDLNQKERNGMEVTLQKSTPILDLNEKVRTFSGKEASMQNSKPIFDLNQISVCISNHSVYNKLLTLLEWQFSFTVLICFPWFSLCYREKRKNRRLIVSNH